MPKMLEFYKYINAFFLPLYKYTLLCVSLSHKLPIKCIKLNGCNVTIYGKLQGVWIILQGTVYAT